MAESDIFIQRLAQIINQYHLGATALFLLDLGQPVTFISGQFLWVAQPALSLFVGAEAVSQLAAVLEEPAAVKQLTAQITNLGNQN
jgi:hypothetical protein